jgi:hypothetical protein
MRPVCEELRQDWTHQERKALAESIERYLLTAWDENTVQKKREEERSKVIDAEKAPLEQWRKER